jgi:hypothetical protein
VVVYFLCNINNGSLCLESVGTAYNCGHPKNLIDRPWKVTKNNTLNLTEARILQNQSP